MSKSVPQEYGFSEIVEFLEGWEGRKISFGEESLRYDRGMEMLWFSSEGKMISFNKGAFEGGVGGGKVSEIIDFLTKFKESGIEEPQVEGLDGRQGGRE